MSLTADIVRTHLDYTAWASGQLLDAARQLSAEELNRDFHTADKSVLGTLVHVFGADRVWLERIHGTARTKLTDPEDYDLAKLQRVWPELHQSWREWAARLTDAQIAANISYRDMAGNPHQSPLWQIILHVVNHGTHHRGAVSGFLRSMGHTPPRLDLIAYYRALAARTAAS
ncbi:MAG TPA: DinB family protein [Bryobacteraceae bacterium]|nr:DinB family protein [Bryobacteraceae bacterium]